LQNSTKSSKTKNFDKVDGIAKKIKFGIFATRTTMIKRTLYTCQTTSAAASTASGVKLMGVTLSLNV